MCGLWLEITENTTKNSLSNKEHVLSHVTRTAEVRNNLQGWSMQPLGNTIKTQVFFNGPLCRPLSV